MKNTSIVIGLLLLITSPIKAGTNGTLVRFQLSNDVEVQCNHWGWARSAFHNLEWTNPCTPLEARMIRYNGSEQTIYSIETTDRVCPDDKVAEYFFMQQPDQGLFFRRCVSKV